MEREAAREYTHSARDHLPKLDRLIWGPVMAKLYFRHGTVGSAKTLNLLAVAHNYRQQNKRVLLMKPSLDNRFGEAQIRSRAGLSCEADLLVHADTQLADADFRGLHCVLVDEAQFVSPGVIDQLRRITLELEVPVICYGLRTDFRGRIVRGGTAPARDGGFDRRGEDDVHIL